MPIHPARPRARIAAALLAATIALAGCVFYGPTSPAHAGSTEDYPESPYAVTDYTEPFRGQYHFSPQNGFMNDINAPLYYRGVYHLFFQHNPHGLAWDTIHWGHATSADLVHWEQRPVALEPGVHSGNLWSGAGWVDVNNVTELKSGDDDPILLFTNTEGVSIAYSTDGAKTFRMYNNGAKVIDNPVESRDPKVQWVPEHDRWEMVTFQANTGAVFYSSTNLLDWTYRGTYTAAWFSECPDLYKLAVDGDSANEKWVLQDASGEYVIGSIDSSGMFVSDWTGPQRMEWGVSGAAFAPSTWYAPQTFNQLPGGRVVQMGWQPSNSGVTWTGNASFPVDVALKTYPEGIRVTRTPIPEIATIRASTQTWGPRTLTTGETSDPFSGISADVYEIDAVFDVSNSTASEFGFRLHVRADGSSDRTVAYSARAQTLYGRAMAPIDGLVKVRLLVDRGQLEIFGNDGKTVVSDNVDFDSSTASRGLQLYASGGSTSLVSLAFSRLTSTWRAAPPGRAPHDAIVSTARQDKCIDRDVAAGRVQLWTCLGNAQQTWQLDATGQLTTGAVCAETPPGQTSNFTLVTVGACTGSSNQQWRQGNFGSLINLESGRCLDIPEADFSDGRQLQVYDCVATRNQSWVGPAHLAPVGSIRWATTTSCVDLDSSGTVQIWTCNGHHNQRWRWNSDGSLTSDGQCLQLAPGDFANGAGLIAAPCILGAQSQQWSRTSNGGIRNIASSRCLDLDSGNTTNGRQLIVWDCVGGPNQLWIGPA